MQNLNDQSTCTNENSELSSTKRIRKSVTRLSEVYDKTFEQKSDRNIKPVFGDGEKLGNILRFQNACKRNKVTGELAQSLHLLCYRTKGKAKSRLISIKKFNGFGSNDESEYQKRIILSDKMRLDELKLLCDLLNVHPASDASKHKKDISIKLVDYLRCPFETGSEVFRTSALKQKTKQVKSKLATKSRKSTVIEKSSKNEMDTDSDIVKDGKISSASSLMMDKENLNETDIPNERIIQLNKEVSPTQDHVKKCQFDVDTLGSMENQSNKNVSDDENLTDSMIKEKILTVLSGADLNKITLNQVCDRVTDQFPNVDLVHRRQHIKSLVKQVIDQS